MTDLDDIYEEGMKAYEEGLDVSCNPYPFHTDEYDAWDNGMQTAEENDGE